MNHFLTRRNCHLILFLLLISSPFKFAYYTKFPQKNLLYACKDVEINKFELFSARTRSINDDKKNTRDFYNVKDNRNSLKYTKLKSIYGLDEKRKQVEHVLSACRNRKNDNISKNNNNKENNNHIGNMRNNTNGNIRQTYHSSITITEINHAITMAGRLQKTDDALEIFESISSFGYRPDLMTYNNIIWCAGNAGRFEISKKYFKELLSRKNLKPNVYTYGSLMHACVKVRGHQQALTYLDRMIAEGITPNLIVFTSAMEACAEVRGDMRQGDKEEELFMVISNTRIMIDFT